MATRRPLSKVYPYLNADPPFESAKKIPSRARKNLSERILGLQETYSKNPNILQTIYD